MTTRSERFNVGLLAACQALQLMTMSAVLTYGGLAGRMLAPTPALATAPVALMPLGSALTTVWASLLMARIGRRRGFLIGTGLGAVAGLTAAVGVTIGSFLLLCLGALMVGAYQAFGQYYRFAAAEVAAPSWRSTAISMVLVGGIFAAFAGPALASWSRDAVAGAPFAGAFLAAGLTALVAMALVSRLRIPRPTTVAAGGGGRPLPRIAAQPAFVAAVANGALGFAVMAFVMNAAPLATVHHHHSESDAATVIQLHLLGMYLPSLFSGWLIQRFGVIRILLAGIALSGASLAVAFSGTTLPHFWASLFLIGVGWNFMFVGGTALLTTVHAPEEKARVQGVNELAVFSVTAAGSLSAGWVFAEAGWTGVLLGALPFLAVALAATLWYAAGRRRAAAKA